MVNVRQILTRSVSDDSTFQIGNERDFVGHSLVIEDLKRAIDVLSNQPVSRPSPFLRAEFLEAYKEMISTEDIEKRKAFLLGNWGV